MKKFVPAFLLLLMLVVPVFSEYYTLEGPYAYVHFPQGYEQMAAKLMAQAEELMPRLEKEMNGKINGKMHLVIEDRLDLANGYTTNVLYPLISFFPVFPDDVLMGGIGPNVSDWFEMLLWHEGTHLYHLEMQDTFSYVLSYLFGRFPTNYPMLTTTPANLEGLAVYNETKYQKFGRDVDAIYSMILDAAIDANDLPDPLLVLGQYDTGDFDLAGRYYLYGWNFMEFLADRYGPNTPLELQRIYLESSSGLFLSKFDNALIKLTGKRYKTLANEWYSWLIENYDQAELNPEGKLYNNSGYTVFPGFFDDKYFYYAQTGKVSPGIYRINLETEEEEMIAYVPNIHGTIRQDRTGKIYFSKLDIDTKGNGYFNIYYYHKGKIEPFVTGQRAYSPYPVGLDVVYYLRHIDGKGNALYKKSADEEAELIYQSQPGEEILQYVVGSTGVVFASIWREGGFTDLARIREGEAYFFTSDSFSDTYPVLSNDETRLFFQSNRDGRYGIWVYDLISGNLAPIVNNHYGAFKPVVNKAVRDRTELAFVSYTNDGLRIGTYRWLGEAEWEYPEYEEIPSPREYPSLQDFMHEGYQLKRYSGLNWLKPITWTPSIFGASIMGADPLMTYSYSLGYNYNPFEEIKLPKHNLSAGISYSINQLNSLSTTFSTNFIDNDYTVDFGYQSIIPAGNNRFDLVANINNVDTISSGISFSMPWGKKDISGTNSVFGDVSYNYHDKKLNASYGTSFNLKASRDLNWAVKVYASYDSVGYKSPGEENLGQNVLVVNTQLNYVFARPYWVINASSTMWSEKMTIAPLAHLFIGDAGWDVGFGADLMNTTTLLYGRAPLDYGLRIMYYPKANHSKPIDKFIFSPVFKF